MRKKRTLRNIIIFLAAATALFALQSVSVLAAPGTDLIISGGTAGVDYTYEDGVLQFFKSGDYTISMADGVDETSDQIQLNASADFTSINLTLDSVKMKTDEDHIFFINYSNSNSFAITLNLKGESSLTSKYRPYHPNLNITDFTIKGSGKLTLEAMQRGGMIKSKQ